MKRIAAVVIVAGIGFAGGAVSAQAANCDGTGACKVDVTVDRCGSVSLDPDPLHVKGNNVIFWEMKSNGYRFRDSDGVQLKKEDTDFDQAGALNNGARFRIHDKNTKATPGQPLSYPYTLNLQQYFLGFWIDCRPFDPTIVNEGS